MIRFHGQDLENRRIVIGLVLSPQEMQQLIDGQSIDVELQRIVPAAIQEQVHLQITYEADMRAAISRGLEQAIADGAKINIIGDGPKEPQ